MLCICSQQVEYNKNNIFEWTNKFQNNRIIITVFIGRINNNSRNEWEVNEWTNRKESHKHRGIKIGLKSNHHTHTQQ